MIYLDITGQCGNQIFQYAFANKISRLTNNLNKIQINFNLVKQYSETAGKGFFYEDNLSHFLIDNYAPVIVKDSKTCIGIFGSKKQNRLLDKYYSFAVPLSKRLKLPFIAKMWNKKLQNHGVYRDDSFFEFVPRKKIKEKNIFIKGDFEKPSLFDDDDYKYLSEVVLPRNVNESNLDLIKLIKNSESVCVSIRVWSDAYLTKKQKDVRTVVGNAYYNNAIKTMNAIHPNAVYIVFSNDLDWVKKNISFPSKVYFESGSDDISNKLYLMSICKNFIIGNSTFSWWAQMLQRSSDKTVIAPKQWYNDGNKKTELFLPNWVLLDN